MDGRVDGWMDLCMDVRTLDEDDVAIPAKQ